MSETEGQQVTTQETGLCEKAAHEVTRASWNHRFHESVFQMATAATIDRIAADVAAVRAKVDALSPEDVRHFFESEKACVAMVEEQRDAAIRERDEWREEARLAVINRDEARTEVERLKNELYDREQEILSLRADTVERQQPPVAPQPAGHGISPGLHETQSAGNAAPAAGWLTEREQHALRHILAADVEPVIRSILARAGSPPVVEVPEEKPGLGHLLHRLYRDAISRAGISWKEVPRE